MTGKHLFFDLDHTLWDFEANSREALGELFSTHQLGQQIEHFEDFFSLYKQINSKLWKLYGNQQIEKNDLRYRRFREVFESFQIRDEVLVKQFSDAYTSNAPQKTNLFPNALSVLRELKKEGYTLHIITNGFKEVQKIKLECSKLGTYFSAIICSEDVGFHKPSKEIFRYAMKMSGASTTQSVMIGDDFEIDIKGALNAGMSAVHFDPHQKWKMDSQTYRIQNLSQLPELLPWVFRSII